MPVSIPSPSFLPEGMKPWEKYLEGWKRWDKNLEKVPWSWPSKGTAILSIPCALQADSPTTLEWLLFLRAPFLFCSLNASPHVLEQHSLALQRTAVPAVAPLMHLFHQPRGVPGPVAWSRECITLYLFQSKHIFFLMVEILMRCYGCSEQAGQLSHLSRQEVSVVRVVNCLLCPCFGCRWTPQM